VKPAEMRRSKAMKQEPAESALVETRPDLVGILDLSKGGEDVNAGTLDR